MVRNFEEEVKALEEYGHDCCARIDDRIHECCKRIREAHEQELDNERVAHEISMALMKRQPSPVTYDVLGNERHKAACELRKLKCKSGLNGSFVCELANVLNVQKDGAPYEDAVLHGLIRDRLIYLLGGDQTPTMPGDLYGILKGDGDGVDAGGRDEAGSVGTDASSPQCACSGRCGGLAEEVAPITTELRNYLHDENTNNAEDWLSICVTWDSVNCLCDAIDAIHANLERENAELRKRTMYPSETERINMLEREVKSLTSECKTQRNNFDQATSAREHWKNLYEQSLEQIHDLEHDVEMWRDRAEDMRMERDDALKEHHEWAPESRCMMLPKDANDVPIHIGDLMVYADSTDDPFEVIGIGNGTLYYVDDNGIQWTLADTKRHYHAPTVEDVLREFALAVCKDDALTIRKGVVEEFAKRLTLVGDAE